VCSQDDEFWFSIGNKRHTLHKFFIPSKCPVSSEAVESMAAKNVWRLFRRSYTSVEGNINMDVWWWETSWNNKNSMKAWHLRQDRKKGFEPALDGRAENIASSSMQSKLFAVAVIARPAFLPRKFSAFFSNELRLFCCLSLIGMTALVSSPSSACCIAHAGSGKFFELHPPKFKKEHKGHLLEDPEAYRRSKFTCSS
jgi:hypothetical protein